MTSGFWVSVLTKRVNDDVHLVHFALQEHVLGEFGDRPRLGEQRRVLVGELRGQLPLGAGDELRGLAAGGDEDRRVRVELRRLAQQVGVQRAAQALVAC